MWSCERSLVGPCYARNRRRHVPWGGQYGRCCCCWHRAVADKPLGYREVDHPTSAHQQRVGATLGLSGDQDPWPPSKIPCAASSTTQSPRTARASRCPQWATEAATAQAADGARIPADAYQALLHFLAAVHGFACLETFDHLNWISVQARDELFDAQIELLVLSMGAGPRQLDAD